MTRDDGARTKKEGPPSFRTPLTDDVREHDGRVVEKLGDRIVLEHSPFQRHLRIAHPLLHPLHEFVDILQFDLVRDIRYVRRTPPDAGYAAHDASTTPRVALGTGLVGLHAVSDAVIALPPARLRLPPLGDGLILRLVQPVAEGGGEHGIDDVPPLLSEAGRLHLPILHEAIVQEEETGREAEYQHGTDRVHGGLVRAVLILEFLGGVHGERVRDELPDLFLFVQQQIHLDDLPVLVVIRVVHVPLPQERDLGPAYRVAVHLPGRRAKHARHPLDVVREYGVEEGVPAEDEAYAPHDVLGRCEVPELVEHRVEHDRARPNRVLVLHQLQYRRQGRDTVGHHVVEGLHAIEFRVEVKHDRPLVPHERRDLPHGDHDVGVIDRIRIVSRVVYDVPVPVAAVYAEGHGPVVRPGGVRWIGHDQDAVLPPQHPRALGRVRLPLQAIDVLGDDGVERQRASLGDAEYALGLLLEVGDGDVRPRVQRAVAACDHGAEGHDGIPLDVQSGLEGLTDLLDAVVILHLETLFLGVLDVPAREARDDGRGRQQRDHEREADDAHPFVASALSHLLLVLVLLDGGAAVAVAANTGRRRVTVAVLGGGEGEGMMSDGDGTRGGGGGGGAPAPARGEGRRADLGITTAAASAADAALALRVHRRRRRRHHHQIVGRRRRNVSTRGTIW